MALDQQPVIEPSKDEGMTARENLEKLLDGKPITKKILSNIDFSCSDAKAWSNDVLNSRAEKDKSPVEDFFKSHEIFVTDLGEIYHSLGRLEASEQMLATARAVEWQSLQGEQSHEVFTTAAGRIEEAKTMLAQAREVTLRKLEALMKLPVVGDLVEQEAEKELAQINEQRKVVE